MVAGASSPEGRKALSPLDTLRRRSDFQRVYAKENRCAGAAVLVHVDDRADDLPARLGLTVSRRCGNACVRNRIRRRLREILRLEQARIARGWDIVLTARHSAADIPYLDLRSQTLRCLRRKGVLRTDDPSD